MLAAAAIALPIGGCGSDDVNPDAVATAAERTSAAGGMKLSLEGTASAGGQDFTMSGGGEMDVAAKAAQLDLRMEFEDPPPGVNFDELEFEMRMKDLVFYMRTPLFAGRLPEGADWIKVDLREATEGTGLDFAQLQQMGGSDPTETLRYMKATGEVEEVGTEEVRGVETTHYEATIDLREYPKLAPEGEREAAERTIDALIERTGSETIDVEVWIDDDDLVRRMKQEFTQRLPDGQGEMEMQQTMEMYDFGTEVEIDLPDEDDVFDVSNKAREAFEP